MHLIVKTSYTVCVFWFLLYFLDWILESLQWYLAFRLYSKESFHLDKRCLSHCLSFLCLLGVSCKLRAGCGCHRTSWGHSSLHFTHTQLHTTTVIAKTLSTLLNFFKSLWLYSSDLTTSQVSVEASPKYWTEQEEEDV